MTSSATAALKKMSVGGLNMPSKIRLTKVGAEFVDGVTFDDYLKIGEALTIVGEAWQWWWGDYLNQGEQRFGEKYAQAVNDTGFAAGTLMNAASVAGRIEIARRHEVLSYSHHAAVAYVEPAVQDRLLDEATKGVWSVSRLREAVSTYRKTLANGGEPPAEKKKERAPIDDAARAEYGEDPADFTDPVEELERANATIARLEAEIESLVADDQKAETHKLLTRIEGLEGRLAGETRTKNEAVRQIKYYQRLTADLRGIVGVEQNSELKTKLMALAKAP